LGRIEAEHGRGGSMMMGYGGRTLRCAAFCCLTLALVMFSARPASSEDFGLDQLMDGLRAIKTGTAHFVERKYLNMLSVPLRTEGVLRYVAPDRLERTTLVPKPERVLIERDQLTVERGDEPKRTLSLTEHPEIGALIDSIRATLAGDLATLRRFYAVSLTGDRQRWQLLLEPKEGRLRAMVKSIRITGSDVAIHTVDTEEADGDRTEMIILEDKR
jgi:hypothetical protein